MVSPVVSARHFSFAAVCRCGGNRESAKAGGGQTEPELGFPKHAWDRNTYHRRFALLIVLSPYSPFFSFSIKSIGGRMIQLCNRISSFL